MHVCVASMQSGPIGVSATGRSIPVLGSITVPPGAVTAAGFSTYATSRRMGPNGVISAPPTPALGDPPSLGPWPKAAYQPWYHWPLLRTRQLMGLDVLSWY